MCIEGPVDAYTLQMFSFYIEDFSTTFKPGLYSGEFKIVASFSNKDNRDLSLDDLGYNSDKSFKTKLSNA
jgi:hypothetical protein